MASAATMDNPAPDNDASVKSLGIFLQMKKNKWHNTSINIPLSYQTEEKGEGKKSQELRSYSHFF